MYRLDDQLILSASDLTGHVACPHLTTLDVAAAGGEMERPEERDAHADLIAAKGDEHEQGYLASLGPEVVEIQRPAHSIAGLDAAELETIDAMAGGAPFIFQATFHHDGWRGHADFLRRVEKPTARWAWSYEVMDTKLARRAKPTHVLQLCFYSEQVARLQGGVWPEEAHLVLGDGATHTIRLADHLAHYRRVRDRFVAALQDQAPTYPVPTAHCQVCDWAPVCTAKRREDDHLSLVAGIRSDQVVRLERSSIPTLDALGKADPGQRPAEMSAATFQGLRDQAALQLEARTTGEIPWRTLPPEPDRGLALLPPPSPGDVFFDFEGDPFADDGSGLEYLFGWVAEEQGAWRYTALWAHDRAAEKGALIEFVDWLVARRWRFPDLHVYHYAHYEQGALKRLAGAHGVREPELDDLLRGEVFVDLYRVVRQGLRIGLESYSLKHVERLYLEARDAAVKDAGGSIVEYERWLETGDDTILDDIAHYNEEDCESTRLLRDWLLDRVREAEDAHGVTIAWAPPELRELSDEGEELEAAHVARVAALTEGLPDDPADDEPDQAARRLLADLLDYHRREKRPAWWRIFERYGMNREELIEDTEAIGGLEIDGEPEPYKRSMLWTLRFPPQEHRVSSGDVFDVHQESDGGDVLEIDDAAGILRLKRGPKLANAPLPTGIIGGRPIQTASIESALADLADHVIATGLHAAGPRQASLDLLRRNRPRIAEVPPGSPLQGDVLSLDEMTALISRLDESALFVQGPPGSGKTYRGARVIVELLRRGHRVGIAANAHKAIHNLLHEIEDVAVSEGVPLSGCYKGGGSDPYDSEHDLVRVVDHNRHCVDEADNLVAGTAWLFSRPEQRGALDYLVIDEAGQVSLANAVAMAGSARNVVLLGDPRQLPQVTQAVHPGGSGASVLEHLLGDHDTVPPDGGLFLSETHRLHPDVCAWVSEIVYDNRLLSAREAARRTVIAPRGLSGTGLRFLAVEHEGNRQSSVEEALRIASEIELLRCASVRRDNGRVEPLRLDRDVLVVAAYNRHVACLREHLPPEVPVGTVDKFQGLQAPIVFFSMAASSGEDVPRGLDFLFSRNRVNVALSRAQCLAVIVASPRLLDVDCHTVAQMTLANGLCRAVELASAARAV